jgi:general secretion pathway protein G
MKVRTGGKSSRRGFTLVEILLVVVIIAMLAALAIPNLMGVQEQASIDSAKNQISGFENQLKLYRTQNGSYPSTEQGLKALVEEPEGDPKPKKWVQLLDDIPVDPWGNPYKYAFPGDHNGEKRPDIASPGPDGQEDTDDDVGNWSKEEDGESAANDDK